MKKEMKVYILLSKFTNYFTLNYDSFLYMLLLKYKEVDSQNNVIAFEPTLEFVGNDLDKRQNNIYSEIKNARQSGELEITISGSEKAKKEMSFLTKTQFATAIRIYNKNNEKGWREKDIDKVVNKILEEEKRNLVLNRVDDGSRQLLLFGDDFIFDNNSQTQNLFFLHGAFHIYQDGKYTKKITQDSDHALYEKLEELLNTEGKEVVCIFESTGKLELIQQNAYLRHCYEKLEKLAGNVVIIGSSLADNDTHIFNQINNSQVSKVYISSMPKEKEKNYQIAKKKLPNKEIYLFDAETISYEKPQA